MSSMLKKTGGLSFKPKAARRPATGPAKPSAGSTPATTNTESSLPSTPAAPDLPTPTAAGDSNETTSERDRQPNPVEQPPKIVTTQVPLTSEHHTDNSAPEPAVSLPLPPPPPIIQDPTPKPSNEAVHNTRPGLEPHAPATDLSKHDARQTLTVETENESPAPSGTSLKASVARPALTLEASSPESELVSEPPTTSSSPTSVSDGNNELPRSNGTAAPIPSAPQPTASKRQAPRRRKSAVIDDGIDADDSAPKKKRQRKTPSSRKTSEASESTSAGAQRPSRRRQRGSTPENAEERTIDHSTMTVGELTKDLGIGKRFRHAEEIERRARDARAKYRLKKLDREKVRLGLVPPEDEESPSQDNLVERGGTLGAAMAQIGASMEAGAGQGVGYDVVDGQIVVHAASLVVDRHNHDMSNLEEVEENDFTNLVNSASFSKRVQTPGSWPEEDTEKFYRLLGMFGTDFETISRLFPDKNRRAIKLKFNKEERLNPGRINATMMVRGQKTVNIDIEEYKASQRQWQAKDKILAEQARLNEEHEREVARLREERRAAGLIDDDQGRSSANGKTNSNTKNGANNSAQGGEEFEVIEEDADALGTQ